VTQKSSENPDPLSDFRVVNVEDLDGNWREAPRGWGHSMHKLAPYVGGFPPSLAHYFIKRFSNPGDRVFDPFCGGGTTPLEALNEDREAIANDAFSYAHTITHAKCKPLSRSRFDSYLDKVFSEAADIPNSGLEDVDSDVDIFFHDETLDELLRLKKVIAEDSSQEALFLKGLISGILHGPSKGFLSIQTKDTFSGTPNYVRKYIENNDLTAEYRNVREKVEDKYEKVTSDGLVAGPSEIYKQDATEVVPNGDVDFILTSPPYMHVLDYTWNNWLRLWWLNEDKDKERDDIVITADYEKYKSFITRSLEQMYEVLAPNSRAVIVIGGVRKHRASGTKKVRVPRLIAKLATEEVGFQPEAVIDDAYGLDKRSYVKFNDIRYEKEDEEEEDSEELIDRCIVLKKGDPQADNQVTPPWQSEL